MKPSHQKTKQLHNQNLELFVARETRLGSTAALLTITLFEVLMPQAGGAELIKSE